ncbi:hypothetical protein NC651_006956 [Populus alba x Populus x berolinensis]|nr:hypothetical protein NC651_006956 [Populus alba x Populus x berolinensis]
MVDNGVLLLAGRGADDCLGGAGILRCKRPRARDDGSMGIASLPLWEGKLRIYRWWWWWWWCCLATDGEWNCGRRRGRC